MNSFHEFSLIYEGKNPAAIANLVTDEALQRVTQYFALFYILRHTLSVFTMKSFHHLSREQRNDLL